MISLMVNEDEEDDNRDSGGGIMLAYEFKIGSFLVSFVACRLSLWFYYEREEPDDPMMEKIVKNRNKFVKRSLLPRSSSVQVFRGETLHCSES